MTDPAHPLTGPELILVAQAQAGDQDLEFKQGAEIDPHLHGLGGELRSGRRVGGAEADVLGDEAAVPAPAHAGELQFEAVSAEFVLERPLEKAREPDLIDVEQGAEQDEHEREHTNAETAEQDSALSPEPALFLRRHDQGT